MIGSALVLKRLEKMDVEVVYVDEFSFDPRKAWLSGWSLIDKKIICSAWDFRSMSFILGLLGSHYYGIVGRAASIDSKFFMVYHSSLLEQFMNSENSNNMKLVIVADNATSHKSNWISKFASDVKIGIITIWPYSLWLNPIEAYISATKEMINASRKQESKPINFFIYFLEWFRSDQFKNEMMTWAYSIRQNFEMVERRDTRQIIESLNSQIHQLAKKFSLNLLILIYFGFFCKSYFKKFIFPIRSPRLPFGNNSDLIQYSNLVNLYLG